MEENKDKKPSKIETFNDLIKTFVLPLGGLCVTLVIIYFSKDTVDCLRKWAKYGMFFFGTIVVLGSLFYILASIYRMNKDIKLSEVEKNINNSQKLSRNLLEKNIKTIEKQLRKLWKNKIPYRNLCYKNLDLNLKGNEVKNNIEISVDDNSSKNKKSILISRILKKTIKDSRENNIKVEKTQILCDALHKLQRLLLEMGEYKIREQVGYILLRYSNNIYQLADAHIDFLGWTYMLGGTKIKAAKGEKHINKGINLLKFYEEKLAESCDYENKKEVAISMARAYRHLGTTRYVIRKEYSEEKSKAIMKYLTEADKYLNDFKGFCKKQKDENDDKKIKRMDAGIKYNKCLIEFFDVINGKGEKKLNEVRKNLLDVLDIDEAKSNNIIKDILEKEGVDPHRKIKILSLLSDIDFRFVYNYVNEKSNLKEISDCLAGVEEILRDSIYFDEGMELYLEQKFEKLCYDINQLNNKK